MPDRLFHTKALKKIKNNRTERLFTRAPLAIIIQLLSALAILAVGITLGFTNREVSVLLSNLISTILAGIRSSAQGVLSYLPHHRGEPYTTYFEHATGFIINEMYTGNTVNNSGGTVLILAPHARHRARSKADPYPSIRIRNHPRRSAKAKKRPEAKCSSDDGWTTDSSIQLQDFAIQTSPEMVNAGVQCSVTEETGPWLEREVLLPCHVRGGCGRGCGRGHAH